MRTDPGYAIPNVKFLNWINLATNSADQIATVALPVLFVARLRGDAGDTSLLTIAATLPLLRFGLAVDELGDSTPLRRVILGGELVRFRWLVGLMTLLALSSP